MARFVDLRIASLSSLSIAILLGALVGCGDDTPGHPETGGSGGAAGSGGSGGGNGGSDAGGAGGTDAGTDTVTTEGGMDTMGEVSKPCYMVAFTAPTDGAMLTAANDKDGDNCGNGFQIDVQITTDAPDGADVSLFGDNALLKAGTVLNGAVTFSGVQLAASGDTQLAIQFPGREMCTAATSKAKVNVDCHVPTCDVTKPVISGAHPKLNGVQAPAGDRVSQAGSPYQAAFEVTTDVEDGQTVSLLVDDAATPSTVTTLTATATGGKATFGGVTLAPDATYEVQASCPRRNGVVGHSNKGTYVVDTTPPSLTVSQPVDGQFFGPPLTNGSFAVFASTTSADAANLGSALGAAAQNLCAFIGNSPLCVAVAATGASTEIDIPCNGGAPFDITVVLNDDAGNTTSTTINAVACASMLPSVQIITPQSDANLFNDPTKHLLAPTGGVSDVVACTNRAGTAVLSVGHMGDQTLTQMGGAVSTTPAGVGSGCPAGFGFIATFANARLPESLENADGTLQTPTELRVDVTDISTATGKSLPLDVWVDSVAPAIGLTSPTDLCGSFHQTGLATFDTPVVLASDTPSVTLTVTNGATTTTLSPTTFAGNVATFANVSFGQGQNTMAAVATDPAGNSTTLATTPAPCTVTLGMAPVVVFTSPTVANELCANGSAGANCIDDTTPGTSGWQGPLTVQVTGGGNPIANSVVTFTVGTTTPTTLGTATTDANGNATLSNATLMDGTVTVTATTDNVPGRGVGSGTVTVIVDTGPPGPVTSFTAALLQHRQTSFQLSWNAPADNGGRVAGYQVRYAKVLIDATNFDDTSVTTAVTYTGSPAAEGAPDGIAVKNLAIETGYFFAVRPVDAAGNLGAIVGSSSVLTDTFQVTTLTGQLTTDHIGYSVDGTGDLGGPTGAFAGDGLSDLVVGAISSNKAYIYFASTNGYPATPSVTITGSFTFFGLAVVNAGDVDGDGLADIAIASPSDVNGKVYIFSRKNAAWSSNSTWPSTLTDTQANYVISADTTYAGKFFGQKLASARSFSGGNDLVIGTPGMTTNTGQVLIVKGGASFGSVTLPDTTNTIVINGTATGNLFGFGLLDIGPFDGSSATTLLVSGTGMSSVFAFTAAGLPAQTNGTGAAVDSTVWTPASNKYGSVLSLLGPLGSSPAAVAISATGFFVDVHLGTTSSGPFLGAAGTAPTPTVHFVDSASTNSFGVLTVGSGVPGTALSPSLIGSDSTGDLVLAGQGEAGNPVYVVNGGDIAQMSGTVDVSTSTKALKLNKLPSDWKGYGGSSIIVDSNNDGFPDIAIGEFASTKAGRIIVLY